MECLPVDIVSRVLATAGASFLTVTVACRGVFRALRAERQNALRAELQAAARGYNRLRRATRRANKPLDALPSLKRSPGPGFSPLVSLHDSAGEIWEALTDLEEEASANLQVCGSRLAEVSRRYRVALWLASLGDL